LLKHENGKILIKVFLKMKKIKINKIIKIVKTQKRKNINKSIFKLKSINKPLKLLKHKKGKILIKVFLN
jgi:hypothetical protein